MASPDPATVAAASAGALGRLLAGSGRGPILLLLLFGGLLFLPAIGAPYLLDDYLHRAMVDGRFVEPRGPFDLYDFVNPTNREAMLARGLLPWWSHPELVIRFWRPLSSLLRWVELRLFAEQVLLAHLHSLLWWGAAVLATARLLRRRLPARAALLATAIFALGPWHVLPLAWLANREVLISLVLGLVALDAHDRFRDAPTLGRGLLAGGLFGLSTLAGEYALCFGGYVLARELVEGRAAIRRRLVGLAPFAGPALLYLGARALLGYGTYGSAFYADPLHEPLAYLRYAPSRLVTLLAEGWLTLGTDAWGTDAPKWLQLLLVAAAALVLPLPLRRVLGRLAAPHRRAAGWLLGGSLLSLLPVMAVVPAPRLLGVSAVGLAATVGLLLDHAWFPTAIEPRRGLVEWTSVVATVMGFLHLIHGPGAAWLAAESLRRSSVGYAQTAAALRRRLVDPQAAEVLVLRGGAGMFFGPFALDPGGHLPARWRILAHTGHLLVLRRDERTVELVTAAEQSLFPIGPGNLFRSEGRRVKAGEVVTLPGLRIEILAVGPRGPTRLRATFDEPLDQRPKVWIQEGYQGFREVKLPQVGFGAPFDP